MHTYIVAIGLCDNLDKLIIETIIHYCDKDNYYHDNSKLPDTNVYYTNRRAILELQNPKYMRNTLT